MRMTTRYTQMGLAAALAMCGAACGDDDSGLVSGDNTPADRSLFASESKLMPAVSATTDDMLYGVTFDRQGNVYATGFVSNGVTDGSDRSMMVMKMLPSGALDVAFGVQGVALKNVAVGGKNGEMARGIVVQSTGKIVVYGTIEHDVAATGLAASDRDVALVRFNANGTLDTTFGDQGVLRLDLGTGTVAQDSVGKEIWAGADSAWAMRVDAQDRLMIHGVQRSTSINAETGAQYTDTDWVVGRLTAEGQWDATFGTNGRTTVDIGHANANARDLTLLADGSILAGGYTNAMPFNKTQPVVYKLTAHGALDATFGTNGIFYQLGLAELSEVYGMALQGDKIVTIGYGRARAEDKADWVSLRLNARGEKDTTWGNGGVLQIDVAGADDNGRHCIGLPGNRVLMVGSGKPNASSADGMMAVFNVDGDADEHFHGGLNKLVDLGGTRDAFFGAAISPDGKHVAVVGYKGASDRTLQDNDDAAVMLMQLSE